MDRMIKKFKNSKFDIITNQYPRTYPKGLACEVAKTKIFFEISSHKLSKNFKKSTFLIIFIKIQKIIIFIIFLFIGNTINLKIEILV